MRRTTPYYPYRTPPFTSPPLPPLSLHRLSLGRRPVVCVTPITLYHHPTGSARRVIQSCTESLLRHRRSIAKSPPNGPLIGVSQTAPKPPPSRTSRPFQPGPAPSTVLSTYLPRRDTGRATVNNHPGLAYPPWCT
ncbi:uncharacterized protein LY79DRAFT_128218 [Colletotrichum navitas]|uniref:Uncharacterized protein n=1 Tax=Colletotrichum navitas TaxID=681940 RepID=A0AAD8Q4E0_9PEZI|nr:uncharacterized protein LY79DRAFT_128218 [Colletotrichum navitas]KAK1594852.1 hypothetical protein LY79DRAFT_128218 [Colletotrichum navitas]